MTAPAEELALRPLGPLLWSICTQTTLSVATYGVYALTNAWFVGRFVGAGALAAVNVVTPVLLVLGAMATTVGAGGASLVSRHLGAGDVAGARRATGSSFVLYWSWAALVTVVGLSARDPLLRALGATPAIMDDARTYAVPILAAAAVATGFSSLIRAVGAIRYATLTWIIPVCVQIVLDPILIIGANLGVLGAALGTVGGLLVSAGMSMAFFFGGRNASFRMRRRDLRPHIATMRAVVTIGAPSFLTQLGALAAVVLANNVLARTGGVAALAAFAVATRITTFVQMPHLGMAQGLQPVVGFSAGRGDHARAHRAVALLLRASLLYGLLGTIGVALAARPIAAMFVSDPFVLPTAAHAVRVIALSYPAAGMAVLIAAACQALGRARPAYLLTAGGAVAVRLPLLAFLAAVAGTEGVWWSFACAEVVCAVLAWWVWRGARHA